MNTKLIPAFSVEQATEIIEGLMKLGELRASGRLPLGDYKELRLRTLKILTGQANNCLTVDDIVTIVNATLHNRMIDNVAQRKS